MREARRVLVDGGRLLLLVRTKREGTAARGLDRSARFGAGPEQVAELARIVELAGFAGVAVSQHEVGGELMTAVEATRR